ncbi:glycerophosphodiester phosphodiesterase family protein [Desulfovibrio sp. JC010]|uniref:glycerophosphodiester phosphodiesterase n=1 Tax=Desulfovibrio sp. JC010 TaxID=2593641 RepID=UPI0013D35CB7|nr:glycerophosphodiester phosphodiesterase family protein [Desulfovibrio sp. JC010]NDV25604.1 glycerophosphodiester phosphodiesterase [Desulfovibrio sp. JC010]
MSLKLINSSPLIWAHRGGRSLGPENTLAAVRKGKEAGADGWELDVQMTKDGEIILLHDLNLLRSTNAGVHPLFVGNPPLLPWRFTLAELKTLSADIFPRRFCPPKYKEQPWRELPESLPDDLRIPTLAEALSLSRELDMFVNVEIKDLSKAVPDSLAGDIVERVLGVIRAQKMDDQVVVSSFNHDYVRRSKEIAPHILTGALTEHNFSGDPVEAVRKVNADAWHPGYRCLTDEGIVKAVREAGLAVNPYTVNEVEDMQRLTDWGVTGLVTDYPQNA